jgi:hypothetical protein
MARSLRVLAMLHLWRASATAGQFHNRGFARVVFLKVRMTAATGNQVLCVNVRPFHPVKHQPEQFAGVRAVIVSKRITNETKAGHSKSPNEKAGAVAPARCHQSIV